MGSGVGLASTHGGGRNGAAGEHAEVSFVDPLFSPSPPSPSLGFFLTPFGVEPGERDVDASRCPTLREPGSAWPVAAYDDAPRPDTA